MRSSNVLLTTALLLFSSLGFGAAVKDTNPVLDSVNSLNKTLSNNLKESSRLNKELIISLEHLNKIADSGEIKTYTSENLEDAKRTLVQVNSSIEETKSYSTILSAANKLVSELEKKINAPIEYISPKKISHLSLDNLSSSNNQAVLDLETERSRRISLDLQLNKLNDRREKISAEISEFNARMSSIKPSQSIKSSTDVKESQDNKVSELLYNVELLFVSQKLIELEWEQRSFDIRREILRNERQLAERNVLMHEKNATVLQEALNLARTKAATESIANAATTSKKFGSAHPAVQKLLDLNQDLAAESAEISAKITDLSIEKQSLDQTLESYRQNFNSIRDKINSAGLSETIGIRLRSAKNQLPDLSFISQRLNQRRNEVEKVQLRRIELEDRYLELVDVSGEVNQILEFNSFVDEMERKQLAKQLTQILDEQKNKFLPDIIKTYDNYFEKTLIPVIEREKEYIKLIEDYTVYIDERILWVKSSQVLSHHDFIQSFKSISWLINPASWATVITNFLHASKDNLFTTVLLGLMFVSAFFIRSSFLKKLKHYGRYKTKLSLAKFSDSLMSGVYTLLLAAYWPLLFWLVALGLLSSQSTDTFTLAVAQGLLAAANVLFFVILFVQMVRTCGIAESHFRWKADNIILIKHQLIWFGPLIIPLVFILQTANNQPIQSHFDGMGRLSFIAITLLITLLMYKLLNPQKGLFKEEIHQHKEGWLNRTHFIWLPLVLSFPLALAVTAISGYLYTATELMMLLINSFWIILAAIIARGFLIRWLNIAQRKLAIEQVRKKIAMQSEANTHQQPADITEANTQLSNEENKIDVSEVSNQTLKLLNNFTGFAVVIGLYILWADILPALNILDDVTLWQSDTRTADGQIITSTISLANGLAALAILLITTLVGVNIPGLLEIAILQRLPFTPSARYGITTIARYMIVILGMILTFNAIGIGWSKVQWLAAAITVGLGFGLQEIFANFVSGIIILIERQIRVGDAVTVGDISGRVSRIKMRATTIVDWDKKELIIPNKEFVTGQVINWTLSDTIIRLVIPVGVAYGSDTDKVHDALIKIAKENEFVLSDPEPEAFFSEFGESTLDFELRVFLPNSDLRVSTRHNLLMQIDQKFRQENIEIAFPQRDLHIRSIVQDPNQSLGGAIPD